MLHCIPPQVSLMQHELEALRQGLSGRQAAALEAARGEFAGALQEAQAELEAVRQRACEHGLVAARQGKALASIMRVLAVHAGEEAGLAGGEGGEGGSGAGEAATAGPDPSKAVEFVEAVSAAMLDLQQQWQLERNEMAQVGAGAPAGLSAIAANIKRCKRLLVLAGAVSGMEGQACSAGVPGTCPSPPALSALPPAGAGGGRGGARPAGGPAGAGADRQPRQGWRGG